MDTIRETRFPSAFRLPEWYGTNKTPSRFVVMGDSELHPANPACQGATRAYPRIAGWSSQTTCVHSGDKMLPRVPTAPEAWAVALDTESAL